MQESTFCITNVTTIYYLLLDDLIYIARYCCVYDSHLSISFPVFVIFIADFVHFPGIIEVDDKDIQNETDMNIEILSASPTPPSTPSQSRLDNQSTARLESIETMHDIKPIENTDEIKEDAKQDGLKEYQNEENDILMPIEKSIAIEQKIDTNDAEVDHDDINQPDITSVETLENIEIVSELKDDEREESAVNELSSSTKTIESHEEKSDEIGTITHHTRSRRASGESPSVDENDDSLAQNEIEKTEQITIEKPTLPSDHSVPEKSIPAEIVTIHEQQNIETSKSTHESAEPIDASPKVEIASESIKTTEKEEIQECEKEEPAKTPPSEIVTTYEKQTIDTSKLINEATESDEHHEQKELKSEIIKITEDAAKITDKLSGQDEQDKPTSTDILTIHEKQTIESLKLKDDIVESTEHDHQDEVKSETIHTTQKEEVQASVNDEPEKTATPQIITTVEEDTIDSSKSTHTATEPEEHHLEKELKSETIETKGESTSKTGKLNQFNLKARSFN